MQEFLKYHKHGPHQEQLVLGKKTGGSSPGEERHDHPQIRFSHLYLSHLSNNKLLTQKACSLTRIFFLHPAEAVWGAKAWPSYGCWRGSLRAACQQLFCQDRDTTNGRHWGGEAGDPSLGQRRRLWECSWGTQWHPWDLLTSWWQLGLPGPSPCPSPESLRRPGPARACSH